MLHLKRFDINFATGQMRKLGTRVRAPARMKLAGRSYILSSIVHHRGSTPFSGHYIADVRAPVNASSGWLRCDDADVVQTCIGSVTGEAAQRTSYILVYAAEEKNEQE
jgi:uncharacterized UBP type Zn finger protein